MRVNTLLCIFFLFLVAPDLAARYGRNDIGFKLGYFGSTEVVPYFPLQSETTERVLRYDNVIVDMFYSRKVNSWLDMGVDLGFTGVLDRIDNNTILLTYPVSVYFVYKIFYRYSVGGYLGAGLDHWLIEERDGDMQGINGYHGRVSFRFDLFRCDLTYHSIDHFGGNSVDRGGWSVLAGVSYRFSYN